MRVIISGQLSAECVKRWKQDAYFLTQPIFSEEDVQRVIELKEMTGAKIICGLMPLVSYRNATIYEE